MRGMNVSHVFSRACRVLQEQDKNLLIITSELFVRVALQILGGGKAYMLAYFLPHPPALWLKKSSFIFELASIRYLLKSVMCFNIAKL